MSSVKNGSKNDQGAFKKCRKALSVMLIISMLFASACAQKTDSGDAKNEDENTPAASETIAEESAKPSDEPSPEAEETVKEPDYLIEAREINDDVVGWIKIDNTRIDYPVLETDDNEFYIDHDLEKKESKSGAIFMDLRNVDPVQQRHIILYGHNMKNGTMFHDINSYKNKDFFDNNRHFSMWIFGEEREYEVVGQFLLSVDMNFVRTYFESDEDYVTFITELQQYNKFKTDYEPSADDELLTLSTCTYEYEDMRCFIQARRIDNKDQTSKAGA